MCTDRSQPDLSFIGPATELSEDHEAASSTGGGFDSGEESAGKGTSKAADFVTAFARQLEAEAREAAIADSKAKREREKERLLDELKSSRQDRKIKRKFSDDVLSYLWWFSCCCLVIIFLQGFSPKIDLHYHSDHFWNIELRSNGFHIGNTPLTTLIGSTAASAIGLVAIVLTGLFKVKKDEGKSKDSDKKT
ncbi:hypothetical protein [Komagataeibacter oboediens]|uniref:hypothetical protein n=1 Tax=Komagataeibacter oboediens TaxID=65958 RepID=UPI001903028A|nr:hypothetical protein [Komagataeibacter oboediens]GCE79531.1 hypothetical protein MSKU3_1006 [Komagataeibacter oboediens]